MVVACEDIKPLPEKFEEGIGVSGLYVNEEVRNSTSNKTDSLLTTLGGLIGTGLGRGDGVISLGGGSVWLWDVLVRRQLTGGRGDIDAPPGSGSRSDCLSVGTGSWGL